MRTLPFSVERQPLTLVDRNDDDDESATAATAPRSNSEDDDEALIPLFERVLQVIKTTSSSHNNHGSHGNASSITIRPARLAAELGDVSVNEACAELCGLMAAIGGDATFTFEKLPAPNDRSNDTTTSCSNNNNNKNTTTYYNNPNVMVFTFPHDFEKRARAHQRRDSMRQAVHQTAIIGIKVIKIMTAFGLILSLLILTVAAAVGIVAAIVALSRDNRQHHSQRNMLMRQLRTLFYTIRQLLWCFAVFGPSGGGGGGGEGEDQGQDPFLREVAYDLFLCCSLCGNPTSIWYWMRASQLSRRRGRVLYGWGGQRQRLSGNNNSNEMESSVPGVTLVRRGAWRDDDNDLGTSVSAASHRGLLSVAVEFLFGPTPFHPAPTEAQKWKLRAAVLVQQLSSSSSTSSKSSSNNSPLGISMEEMSPYVDYPPATLLPTTNHDDKRAPPLVSQALKIVAHFNGIPVTTTGGSSDNNKTLTQTRFVFPELLAESTVALQGGLVNNDEDDGSWASLLYAQEDNYTSTQSQRQQQQDGDLPLYLHERRYKFTKLTGQQLLHCVGLGSLNAIGVVMLGQSLARGGVLYMGDPKLLSSSSWSWYFMHKLLLPVLRFYAALFFVLPTVRLLWIVILNQRRQGRNRQRQALVKELLERQQLPAASEASDGTAALTSILL
jgi:hypothetical protein